MIQWRQMEVFIAVVENGNFSKAAESLDISPTAVGKWIQSLESVSQEPLFNRSVRKLVLTPFGEEYYQMCKALENKMAQADVFIKSKNEDLVGKLRIHSSSFFAAIVLLPVIAQVKREHPRLEVVLTTGDSIPNLLEENYDLLVGYDLNNLNDQLDLRVCQLAKAKKILAASPEYLKKIGEPKSLEGLTEHSFIYHSLEPKPFKITTADGDEVTNLKTAMALGDQRLLCVAAAHGLGIVFTGSKMILPEIYRKNLKQILPDLDFGEVIISAFYKNTTHEQPKVRVMLDYLKNYMQHKVPSSNLAASFLGKIDALLYPKN